jgi:cephalosporin-C deacetylase-like acetyl esterase
MDNIEDVTDSPEDWKDFWEDEEEHLKTKESQNNLKNNDTITISRRITQRSRTIS